MHVTPPPAPLVANISDPPQAVTLQIQGARVRRVQGMDGRQPPRLHRRRHLGGRVPEGFGASSAHGGAQAPPPFSALILSEPSRLGR